MAQDEEGDEEVDLLAEKDLYRILGVAKGAKPDEIKKAYRKKSLKYHPDKNPSPDAKPKFQKITEAYSILSDDKKRLKYDKSGDIDLEDFDMDQFMNMWVGEMMEDGGVVDDMMKSVLPWTDEDDKMAQFMEEKVVVKGNKLLCAICEHTGSNKRLMLAHFEKKHKFECEEWADETVKSMKASFESFMKQVTGIGDGNGEFVLPDGSKANMSHVKGVPDIRAHMQKRVDKAKIAEQVMDMYRKVAGSQFQSEIGEGNATEGAVEKTPDYVPDPKQVSELLGVSAEEAHQLTEDKEKLLRRLRTKIDQINDEEDEEEAMMEAMGGLGMDGLDGLDGLGGLGGLGGLDLLGGLGGKGGGLGGKGSPGGLAGMMGDMAGLEELLGGMDPSDPAALQALMGQLGGLGGMPGLDGLAGLGGLGDLAGLGSMSGLGAQGGGARGSREPPRPPPGPSKEIGCKCGYSCGTMTALDRHLVKFTGPEHEAVVKESPPSPPREHRPRHPQNELNLDGLLGAGYGSQSFPGRGATSGFTGASPTAASDDAPELACTCGYSCGTENALLRHFDRFKGDPSHVRK